jgi:hypothetical protein
LRLLARRARCNFFAPLREKLLPELKIAHISIKKRLRLLIFRAPPCILSAGKEVH